MPKIMGETIYESPTFPDYSGPCRALTMALLEPVYGPFPIEFANTFSQLSLWWQQNL